MSKKPTGIIVAIKKTRRAPKFMPDEVIISLDGEPKGQLLIVCGWTMTTSAEDKSCVKWPIDRLKKNLERIQAEWFDECGKSWWLEIRPS